MRPCLILLLSVGLTFSVKAAPGTDSTILLQLPDSIKAIQFHAEINVQQLNPNGQASAGISTDLVRLSLENGGISKHIAFIFPAQAKLVAQGLNTEIKKNRIVWVYNWNKQENYKLLVSIAGDSAENFVLYSGYVWLPVENKWKLLGTCRIEGTWNTIKDPAIFTSAKKIKEQVKISLNNSVVWVQGRNNRWYNLLGETKVNPVINLYPHLDS